MSNNNDPTAPLPSKPNMNEPTAMNNTPVVESPITERNTAKLKAMPSAPPENIVASAPPVAKRNTDTQKAQPSAPPENTISSAPFASPFPFFVLPALPTFFSSPPVNTSDPGPGIWGFSNAIAFLVLSTVLLFGLAYGMTHVGNVKHVQKNWKNYRCQPAYMPFASFYGFNTAENFEFCMKNIFTTHSEDITGSFGSVLGIFGTIMSIVMDGINALRTTVATIGGGINVVFQDFTDRIGFFFFNLRLSAMRIKNLIGRMYAILFAVMYMGMSGLTGGMNFGNTVLFSFLDTFCFPPETQVNVRGKGQIPLKDVRVGDFLVGESGASATPATPARVTAKFHFAAGGQPMVRLGSVTVSTNHYILHNTKWIKAAEHPEAVPLGAYERESLVCLNTDTHTMPIGGYVFRDYDEVDEPAVNTESMRSTEATVNATETPSQPTPYSFTDANTAVQRSTYMRLKDGSVKQARQIQIGDELASGGKVVGVVHREQTEFCRVPASASASAVEFLSPATLLWNPVANKWQRAGELYTPIRLESNYWHSKSPLVFLSFIVTPNSQIELASGLRIRDYMELCSPDAEAPYAKALQELSTTVTSE